MLLCQRMLHTRCTRCAWAAMALCALLTWRAPLASAATTGNEARPALMLANRYHAGITLSNYWVSEKFDGVRGYWDGKTLRTRSGHTIAAPAWFTAGWPNIAMDGELWAGRGNFPTAVSTVRQQQPVEQAWRAMRFMVFDLPAQEGTFTQRIPVLNGVVSRIDQPWMQAVVHSRVGTHAALQSLLRNVVKQNGEGLMLHRGESMYQGKRSDDLLKVKTEDDAEARVVGHIAGQGKYAGQLGALLVEIPAADGQPSRRFKLGTGLRDADRRQPPQLGAVVTFRYRGFNASGVPRFASFMRLREEATN